MYLEIPKDVKNHLSKDLVIKPIVQQCQIKVHKEAIPLFEDLIRAIVAQQLSVAAANTIYKRFQEAIIFDNNLPLKILSAEHEKLRSIGLSSQKAQYIKNIATYFLDKNLFDQDWTAMSDDEIINLLTPIKGVGKWTVEMILIFSLDRHDVFPIDDLIVRNQIIKLYNVQTENKKTTLEEIIKIAEQWRPYRSYASRYLWASKGLK